MKGLLNDISDMDLIIKEEMNNNPIIDIESRKWIFADKIDHNERINNKPRELTIDYIENIVYDYYNITRMGAYENTRKRETVQARQIAMYFSKNLTRYSLAIIGNKIGDKDHATVIHACKTVNNLIDTDKTFRYQIEEIEKKLKQ